MKKILNRNEQGAAVVEFAIVVSLFIVIVFGIIEFGFLLYDKHVLTDASREGARAGIVMRVPRLSDDEIKMVVEDKVKGRMVSFGPSGEPDFGPWLGEAKLENRYSVFPLEADRTGDTFGKPLIVTVKYPFNFLVLSNLGFGPITLEAKTRMLME